VELILVVQHKVVCDAKPKSGAGLRPRSGRTKRQVSNVANAANTAARKTVSSFETAAREVIENQKSLSFSAFPMGAGGWILDLVPKS
jgi:hypothetical protein